MWSRPSGTASADDFALAGGAPPFPNAFVTHSHHLTENLGRVGVNHKFAP
jgi:hypothetical protein